jgi:micrococcal nuclease
MRATLRCALIGALVVLAECLPQPPQAAANDTPGGWVVVTQVLDGDTIRVGHTRVRLIGIDAPEIAHRNKPGEYYGPEAAAFARRLLAGKRVRLAFNMGDEVDAYGRVLAYVFLEDGTFVNRELVRRGYARVLTRFPFDYVDDFRQAQTEARRAGLGLWASRPPAHVVVPGSIIGNRQSKVYHLPGQAHYNDVAERNRVYFDSEEEARRLGYRPAKR